MTELFDNSGVRRQDRLLELEDAIKLLESGEYGYLSLIDGDAPYGIPITYMWDGNRSIYLHCAPEGRKLRAIGDAPVPASFCIVGRTQVIPHKFTTAYESIVLEGTIRLITDELESWKALKLLLDKYSPNDKVIGLKYSEKSFHRTRILRIDIERWSGKAKRLQP